MDSDGLGWLGGCVQPECVCQRESKLLPAVALETRFGDGGATSKQRQYNIFR
jgi:hypothetical protein